MYSARLLITVASDKVINEALAAFAEAIGCEVYNTGTDVRNLQRVQVTVHGTETIPDKVFSEYGLHRPQRNPSESEVRALALVWGKRTGYFADVDMGIGHHA